MEELLAQAKKIAEATEVFLVSSEVTPVAFETNRLKHVQSKQTTVVALRLIKQGRIGYAVSTRLEDRAGLVKMAVETAQFGMPAKFRFPHQTSPPQIDVFDPNIDSVTTSEMIRLGEELIATVTEHTPDIICDAEASKAVTSVRIINSEGSESAYHISTFDLGISGTLIRDTDMLFVGDGESSCHPITKSKEVAERVTRQLDLAKTHASLPSKNLPVIFTPSGVASAIMTPLMAAFNGKLVLQGVSPLIGRLTHQVFSSKLNLWDDPTIAYRPESRPFDDEGIPSKQTPLIQEGKIMSFLYDLQTAALANTQSTASASRSGGGLPAPAPSAFVIEAGNATFDEMVSDIKEGLLIEQVMGAGQGNILSGAFSGNVLLGYKVESGKIVGRVKDTMISGNIYEVLNQIVAIGSDTRWVGSHIKTPSLYCPSLAVASK